MLNFLIETLFTWRVCSLLVNEDCPYELCAKFRDRIGIGYNEHNERVASNQIAALFSCVWCLSVWVGVLVARGDVVRGLAISSGVIIVEKWIHES